MSGYTGMFWLLTAVPQWLVTFVVLFAVSAMGIGFYIGDRTNGFYWNTSWSSMADLFLTVSILIGVTALTRGEPLPMWFSAWPAQLLWLAVSIGVGIYLVTAAAPWPHMAWSDRYHNTVVVPFFMFLLPLMWLVTAHNGTTLEKVASALCVAIWLGCGVYDFKDGRLDQRKWLAERYGIEFTEKGAVKPRQ